MAGFGSLGRRTSGTVGNVGDAGIVAVEGSRVLAGFGGETAGRVCGGGCRPVLLLVVHVDELYVAVVVVKGAV